MTLLFTGRRPLRNRPGGDGVARSTRRMLSLSRLILQTRRRPTGTGRQRARIDERNVLLLSAKRKGPLPLTEAPAG